VAFDRTQTGRRELGPALAIGKERDEARVSIATAGTEAEVRRLVAAINARVVYVNSHVTTGPPSDVAPLDAEQVLADWRRAPDLLLYRRAGEI
jgi:hypothetical protein